MASASVTTPTTQSKEVLLLQKEIFTIYLEPLLKIHNNDNPSTTRIVDNANVITYEDLTSSFQLAVASLGKINTNVDVNGKNFVRQKLIALHQSQIQAYHVAAKKALMEWATNVTLPEINNTIHDTVTSYIKSCRTVTIATRPIWRELSTSSTSTKKELPVNEMAMNIIEERAKAAFEKLQQQRKASNHITTATTMENIPEEDGEDEDGEIDEDEDTEGAVVAETSEDDNKNVVNNDAADNEVSDMNEDATNTQQDATTTNAEEVKANPVTAKSPIPPKKNMISLVRKNKPNQTQMPPPPPSKRSNTTTNAKPTTIKKTNITKPINTTVQQHRNNQAMNNRGSGGSGRGGGGNNNSSGRSVGGRGGGGAPRSGGGSGK